MTPAKPSAASRAPAGRASSAAAAARAGGVSLCKGQNQGAAGVDGPPRRAATAPARNRGRGLSVGVLTYYAVGDWLPGQGAESRAARRSAQLVTKPGHSRWWPPGCGGARKNEKTWGISRRACRSLTPKLRRAEDPHRVGALRRRWPCHATCWAFEFRQNLAAAVLRLVRASCRPWPLSAIIA